MAILNVLEPSEVVHKAFEFKYNQLQNEPESFRQVVKSRGAEWLSIVLSYLLRELKNDILQPFNKDKAESEVEAFIKNLPISFLNDLRECATDFFFRYREATDRLSIVSRRKEAERNRA